MSDARPAVRPGRTLIIAIIAVIVVLGLLLTLYLLQRAEQVASPERVDALASSTDDCVTCHRRSSPGITAQYGHSSMAAANVGCRECHEVPADYPEAVAHEGTHVLTVPTTAMCEKCHQAETAQFLQSRHALPAWVAYVGTEGLTADQLAQWESIPEGQFVPNRARNAIGALEGDAITQFACETCHSIGIPRADGSVGDCVKCHIRHEFSLEQARKPETCNHCHIGPDHPQWEIYQESPHGIMYAARGHDWNWEAEPGTLSVVDFPAPTCSICHMSGFGSTGTTHDVGDRLSWFLFAPVSERRPGYQDNIVRMQSVCLECHNTNFITDLYTRADEATLAVNQLVLEGDTLMAPLRQQNLLTDLPFDQPIEFEYFELWHHWGRTAKFGFWMQGPDYSQWHGAYEMVKVLTVLRESAEQLMQQSTLSTNPMP